MTAAAISSPVDRTSDLIEELNLIVNDFDALSSAARHAVKTVVESLLHDIATTNEELAHLNALLERYARHSGESRATALPSRSTKQTRYALLPQIG